MDFRGMPDFGTFRMSAKGPLPVEFRLSPWPNIAGLQDPEGVESRWNRQMGEAFGLGCRRGRHAP
jgi:hypothetical protein